MSSRLSIALRVPNIKNKTHCLDNATVANNRYENGVLVEGVTWYNEPINFDNVLIGYIALFQVKSHIVGLEVQLDPAITDLLLTEFHH